jgi:hypothetical protein
MAAIVKAVAASAKVAEPTLAAIVPKPLDDHALSARISMVAQLAYDKLNRDVVDNNNLRRLVCHANLLDGLMARHPQVVGEVYASRSLAQEYANLYAPQPKKVNVMETILEETMAGTKIEDRISRHNSPAPADDETDTIGPMAAEICSTPLAAVGSNIADALAIDKTLISSNIFTLQPSGMKTQQRLCTYFADLFKESWHDDDDSEDEGLMHSGQTKVAA